LAAAVGTGDIERIAREEFARRVSAEMFEVLTTSQPVDAARFCRRTGWRPRETFRTSIGPMLARL
ncbi:MAG TPA: hypothetical protein VEQ65_04720, partial [Opitutus sp.]|nr:hypothetical protein [Opitutus sp.]